MLKELGNVKPANNLVPLSAFEQYSKSVNNPLDQFYTPGEDIVDFNERYANNEFRIIFKDLNIGLSQDEVLNSIKQLKLNKSGGADMFINEFLVHGKHILAPILCKLFNKIFDIGYVPEEWSKGFIVPLHKKGSLGRCRELQGHYST